MKTTREGEDMEAADTKKRKMCDNGDLRISPAVATVVRSQLEDASIAPASLDSPASELGSSKLENNVVALSEPAVSSKCDDEALTSCCESNGPREITNGSSKFTDLDYCVKIAAKENNSEFKESRETIFSSKFKVEVHKLESTPKRQPVKSSRRARAEKIPSEADLDEFFAAAEKDLLDRSAQKYNFDFMKEKPLEGCYEWVRL